METKLGVEIEVGETWIPLLDRVGRWGGAALDFLVTKRTPATPSLSSIIDEL